MRPILKGSLNHSEFFVLRDSATGLGKTGLVFTDITGSYTRQRAARAAVTMATLASAGAAFSSGGFVEVDATNEPGLYRFDVPDAAFATGVDQVVVGVKATGIIAEYKEFRLVDVNDQDAAAYGLTRLDAAITTRLAPTTAGRTLDVAATGEAGLDFDNIHDAAGAHTLTNITVPTVTTTGTATALTTNNDKTGYSLASNAVDAAQFTQAAADKVWSTAARTLTAFGFSVTVGTNNDKTGYGLSAAAVQAVWDALTSALTTVGSVGKLLVDNVNATISSRLAAAAITLSGGAVTVGTNNDKTGYSLTVTPPTAAQVSTAVWSEALPGSFGAGTAGAKVNSAASAGDPWATAVPGAYAAGTAGNVLGNNLNATVGSRLATSGYTAPLTTSQTAAAVLDEAVASHQTAGTVGQKLEEVHGLLGKYSGLRNAVYSGSDLLSYDLNLYQDAASAATNDGTTGLLHRYTVVNSYDGSSNLLTSITTRVS